MRKLFFLIPAMLLSLAMSADPIVVDPGTKAIYNAYKDAPNGAVLVLRAGDYLETERLALDKSVTIMAEEGADVTVYPYKDNRMTNGAKVKFIGIKFDGSEMGTYGYFIRSYDATEGKELRFEKCEMTGFTGQYLINAADATRTLDSVILNDCKCINNGNDAIYIGAGSDTKETAKGIIVKNSTFANFSALSHSVIEVDNYGSTKTPNIEVTVDHCTFYNNPTSASGYADIRVYKSTKVAISNCIFAHPESYARCGTYCYGGTIDNCLSYNLTSGTKGHRADDINLSTCLPNADPLFNDLANNKYTYAGEYGVSMSPARGAGTDGSDLGDPRWYTEVTYPSTDFASGYVLNGGIAELTGNIEYNTLKSENEADHYLRYYDRSVNGTAIWKIHATRSCYVQATLNMFDNSWNYAEDPAERKSYKNGGHIFAVQLLDMNSNPIDGSVAVAEPSESDAIGDILVPGSIFIPAEGDYIIQLSNSRGYSKCGISSVTLTYAGGGFVTIPSADPIPFADAILSEKATRSLSPAEIHFGSPNASQYAQWNAHASAGLYDITFTFTGTNHGIYQLIIKQGNNTIFSDTKGQGGSGSVSFESVMIPADGDYVIQVANINPGADGYLTSVTAAAAALADAWIIDDEATTEDDIEAHQEVKYIPILKRSFVAGMYNTICVPFDSYDSELTSIFGAGYELLALESATLTDGVLVLNFQTVAGNSFAAGTPYLIKPTQDVVNPQFSKHTIHMYASNHVQHGGAADFIGTYIQKQLNADYDLFLGQNNILHFPSSTSAPLKGLRAYFHVTAASAQAIKRARIVTQEQVITEIDLVNGENQGLIKTIENGQLIINLDGIRYNIMGGKIK